MLNLDPAKLLVIAVVAIILLGPDRLPQVARQVGAAWRSFNEFRHRMEAEVRNTMPDLPPSHEIARLARSPSALLNKLSSMATATRRAGGSGNRGAGRGGATGCGRGRPRPTWPGRGLWPGPGERPTSNGDSASLPDCGRRRPVAAGRPPPDGA